MGLASSGVKEIKIVTNLDLEKVKIAVEEVVGKGFGKVEIIIQNGCILRIIKSEDILLNRQVQK